MTNKIKKPKNIEIYRINIERKERLVFAKRIDHEQNLINEVLHQFVKIQKNGINSVKYSDTNLLTIGSLSEIARDIIEQYIEKRE